MRVRCPGQNPLLLGPVLKANKNTFTIYYLRGYTILVVQLYLYNGARGYKSGTTAFYRPAVSLNDPHSVKKKLSRCTIASWEEKSLHHIAIIAKFIDLNKPRPPNMAEKKQANKPKIVMFKVWLSFAWYLLFFHHLTIQVAVSVKKDCWDSEILRPC